ncbi:MAG: putative replicase [Circoviridae sp.]|nr:MAG: putative replicase [Circoviridae sp.]
MARNRKGQHYPVVRTGRLFRQSPDPIGPKCQISAEQLLSKTNRRLYRQSRFYELKLDLDPNATRAIDVFVLADTWMVERALKMGYAMYLENSEAARDRLKENAIARWEDFRVISGAGITIVNPLQYSEGFVSDELNTGEFDITQVVDANNVTREFTWGPGSASKYSLLGEYDKAGNTSQDPTFSTGDMPYDDLQADDSAAIGEDLQNRGNKPPYNATGVNADKTWIKICTLDAASTAQKLSSGYFTAPCGFVLLADHEDPNAQPVAEADIQWTVKAGDYKGVHAPSMLE